MNESTERTRLIDRERQQSLVHESFELDYQREPRQDGPSMNERSVEEIGIDAALEPALGRKTWKGFLILILTPLLLCPLPIIIQSMVGIILNKVLVN